MDRGLSMLADRSLVGGAEDIDLFREDRKACGIANADPRRAKCFAFS
jgi:hypothetical protein